MNEVQTKRWVFHELFEAGVVLKGINAVIELSLGLLLLVFNVSGFVRSLIANALVEDPDNFLATHLQPLAEKLSPQAETYSALYLISHGLIKAVLVWGLLRGKMWSYPASIAVMVLFITYQSIQFLASHSWVLMVLNVFDVLMIWLIWVEYKRVSARRRVKA